MVRGSALWLVVLGLVGCSGVEPSSSCADWRQCEPGACGTSTWGWAEGEVYLDREAEGALDELDQALSQGSSIVLSAGEWPDLDITVPGTRVAGRCADLVHVASVQSGVDLELVDLSPGPVGLWQGEFRGERLRLSGGGLLLTEGADAVLDDVKIFDPEGVGLRAIDAEVRFRYGLVSGASGAGIDATRSWLDLDNLRVERTGEGEEGSGDGLRIMHGGASLEDVDVQDSARTGLRIEGEAQVWGSSLYILDTTGSSSTFGTGVFLGEGSKVSIGGLAVHETVGIGVISAGSELELENASIMATKGHPDQPAIGFRVEGGVVDLGQVRIVNAQWSGLSSDGGIVTARALTVEVIRSGGPQGGRGMEVWNRGSVSCEGCFIHRTTRVGALAGEGSGLTLTDSEIRAVGSGDERAVGVFAGERSEATLDDVFLGAIHGPGVYTQAGASELDVTDLEVSGAEDAGVVLAGGSAALGEVLVTGQAGGIGVLALPEVEELRLTEPALSGHEVAGLLLHGVTATVEGGTWADNGVDVLQQGCEEGLEPPEGVEGLSLSLCPEEEVPLPEGIEGIDFEEPVVSW